MRTSFARKLTAILILLNHATEILNRPQFASITECTNIVMAFRWLVASTGTSGIRRLPNRIEVEGLTFGQLGLEDVRKSLTQIRTRAIQALEELYKPRQRLYIEFTLLSEMHPGDAHTLHSDSERRDATGGWVPNHTPWREFAMMLYLNTSGVDYGGGVLRFPELGRQVIPEAGLLVGFPCGRTHQHEVTPIETGLRYSVSIWTTADPARTERWW
jgi:hypothetical protein